MRVKKNQRLWIAYICCVILPVLIIIFYLSFFAKDRYESSSTILVKQVADTKVTDSSGLGSLLGVSNTSREDSQILKEYIASRDMIERLDKSLDLRKEFSSVSDPVFALPKYASIEELVEYLNFFFCEGCHSQARFALRFVRLPFQGVDAFLPFSFFFLSPESLNL